jgi:hypothetical protein
MITPGLFLQLTRQPGNGNADHGAAPWPPASALERPTPRHPGDSLYGVHDSSLLFPIDRHPPAFRHLARMSR